MDLLAIPNDETRLVRLIHKAFRPNDFPDMSCKVLPALPMCNAGAQKRQMHRLCGLLSLLTSLISPALRLQTLGQATLLWR